MQVLTYPARPVNGGKFERAPSKHGDWLAEPKYNGWRALIHAPTGNVWNRHGKPLSIADKFTQALRELKDRGYTWVDAEALQNRTAIGKGTLIVFDLPDLKQNYPSRVKHIDLDELPIGIAPSKCCYKPPRYRNIAKLYEALKIANNALQCDFYEGVVCKRMNSHYPIQLSNPNSEFPYWMKHRFL